MKKQTTKELKIKDLFTLSERTNNGAVVTTLENGNKYCFGYFSENDKQEDIKNIMAKRERKVTASLSRRDLNKNVFEDQQNKMLMFWRNNLDKVESVKTSINQLARLEEKDEQLHDLYISLVHAGTYTDEYFKYSDIRKEIETTIKQERKKLQNITKRYLHRFSLDFPVLKYCTMKQLYNALPSNWEEMAKQGVTSVNTELSEAARTQTAPEPTAVETSTAVEVASMAATEPTAVETSTAVEGASMPEPTTVETSTAVEGASVPEPTTVETSTAVEGVESEYDPVVENEYAFLTPLWVLAAACIMAFFVLTGTNKHIQLQAAPVPTVATISEAAEAVTISEAADVVTIEATINDVICTGSFDRYYNRVKEEITRNYRESLKSQLQELTDLASVDDSEVIAAIEATETDPETPESVPTVETITDTENTPESVEIMPTETDTETDTGTVSDNTEIDYNSSEYVELSVTTIDANGNQVVNVYSVPLNE